MPGIFGSTHTTGADFLSRMKSRLTGHSFLYEHNSPHDLPGIGCYSIHAAPRILTDGAETIMFDGYLLDTSEKGEAMLRRLIDLFRTKGELFVRDLRGSFQIAICRKYDGGCDVYLYVDHSASRPLFIAETADAVFFSPEIAPLFDIITQPHLDVGSLAHFMMAGHFQAGMTLASDIRLLGPGRYISCTGGRRAEWKTYFEHTIVPARCFEPQSAIEELSATLDRVIIDCWRHASNPAILLSGGLDSRYIFYTIAQHVTDASTLVTVSWGDNPGLKNSDVEIAGRIARRYGTRHLYFPRETVMFSRDFTDMFHAQSGMTDSIAAHCHEMEICRMMRQRHGIESLIRGDECFGFGPCVHTTQDALLALKQSLGDYIPDREKWFAHPDGHIWEAFEKLMLNKISRYALPPNRFKDTLYFNERLPMALHPSNYFKYFYQDVLLPYLDPRVLSLMHSVPDKYRHNKHIFRLCMQRRFGSELDIPFASLGNWTDWDRTIRQSSPLAAFLQHEIEELPPVFNRGYFLHILDLIRRGADTTRLRKKIKNALVAFLPRWCVQGIIAVRIFKDRIDSTEDVMRLFRAIILSRMIKLWFDRKDAAGASDVSPP